MSEEYEGEIIIPLVDFVYMDRKLSPEILIVAVFWHTHDIRVLEVVNFKTRRKGIKDIASEKMEGYKGQRDDWSIHRIWNTDMHIANNRRLLI